MKRVLLLILFLFTSSPGWSAPVITVLGDSLSAGFGLSTGEGWVDLLRQRLRDQQHPYRVINASISGDTTGGALARLPQALDPSPHILIVELGGNDGLRGLSLKNMEANLRQIIQTAHSQGSKVLLLGMQIPPNYGPLFTQQFQEVYARVARDMNTPLVPFLLAGLEDRREFFQRDQIHPNAEAQPILLDNVWPELVKLL